MKKAMDNITVSGSLWINSGTEHFLGKGRIELLERIAETGSIAKAAKDMKMSYKAAWDAIDAMNNLADEPLLERVSGGKGGGGSQLTERGRKVIELYRNLERGQQIFIEQMRNKAADFDSLYTLLRGVSMKTSARNQFAGKILAIISGAVNSEVVIGLKGADTITAIITNESCEELELTTGTSVYALVKASWVMIMEDDAKMKISARNRLRGTVAVIHAGAVNSEVTIALKGGNTVTAVITKESVKELGLKKGKKVCAVFKASSVIIALSL
jgi:molybdate transport system regulatory protein